MEYAVQLFASDGVRLDWLDRLREPAFLVGLSLSLGLLGLVSLLGLPFLLVRIPADYFTKTPTPACRGSVRWFRRLTKNLFGGLLLLLGIAMLVLPGQGLLTIIAALVLMDFPGKRRFERWLIQRPRVLSGLNFLRKRAGRPPLEFEHQCSPD